MPPCFISCATSTCGDLSSDLRRHILAMAGLETIASIVGIAGVGIKLAKTLYQVGYKTASANHNINRIATNVSLFASMLKHVGSVLDDAHSLHTPEAVEMVKQIVKECESNFQDITDIIVLARDKSEGHKDPPLANGSKRRISMIARAKWYFEGPRAEYLLAQLEYLKSTLSVLLQTLNLAALTAKIHATLGQSERPSEIVQQERLHVETLIIAQQLSVHNLQETQEKLDAESTRPSSPSEDNSLEPRYPKLLTQGSQTSMQMVRLGNGDLDISNRKAVVATGDGAPLELSTSRSERFIDDLLAKWTMAPEEKLGEGHRESSLGRGEDLEREATPVPATRRTKSDSPEVTKNSNMPSVPNVKIAPSTSPPAVPLISPITETPSRQWMSTLSDMATLASRESPTSRVPSALGHASPDSTSSQYHNRVGSPQRSTLERSFTNPEGDGMPTLNSFHDHHGLQSPISVNRSASPRNPPSSTPPQSQSRSPYHANALAPYMAGAAAASGNMHLSPGWSNYKQPYVSDEDSTWSPSDSEDSRPASRTSKAPRQPRRESNTSVSRRSRHKPHDSGFGGDTGDGLGIPWRIRVSDNKYFDFRDDMLVGPRTPYLPSEPRSWIYSQEHACTEISKQWVCEEALIEMRYPHNVLRDSEPDIVAIAGEEGGWRILSALKFVRMPSMSLFLC